VTGKFAEIDKQLSTRRILTLDIERIPGRFAAEWRGMNITGDFWDLSDGKWKFGRRIRPDEVTEWPSTCCAAWRHYGEKRYGFTSVWGSEDMAADIGEQLDWAEIVVGHNVDAFDLKKINAQLWLEDKPVPTTYKTVDTLKILRSRMGLESNTLQSACDRAGIQTKVDHYDPTIARAAVSGDIKAQRRIERYNKGDIAATEALYNRLRPWIANHPHVLPDSATPRCHVCGSDRLERAGTYTAQVNEYAAYRCQNCGANLRAGLVRRVATTRGIR
jgi:hypothetical protein